MENEGKFEVDLGKYCSQADKKTVMMVVVVQEMNDEKGVQMVRKERKKIYTYEDKFYKGG